MTTGGSQLGGLSDARYDGDVQSQLQSKGYYLDPNLVNQMQNFAGGRYDPTLAAAPPTQSVAPTGGMLQPDSSSSNNQLSAPPQTAQPPDQFAAFAQSIAGMHPDMQHVAYERGIGAMQGMGVPQAMNAPAWGQGGQDLISQFTQPSNGGQQ